ncbi:MAG TPA: hypothetical protein VI299_28010, partial [Polyangiales bacterium]
FQAATIAASGATTTAPSAASPGATLRLGATNTNAQPARMRWGETLIFARVLHEFERQVVREYIAARYGITAPRLEGADRDIMSLLPFSWMEAAAHVQSGGKVTAFLDRARPGHVFTQSDASLQVAAPMVDVAFRAAATATFVRASGTNYQSSLPASSWRFAHNGEGCQIVAAVALATPAVSGFLFGTRISSEGLRVGNDANAWIVAMQNTGAFPILTESAGVADSTPVGLMFRHATAANPQWSLRRNGMQLSGGAYTATPSTTGPDASMRIGSHGSGAGAGDFRSPGMVFFDRVLTAVEEAQLQAAFLSKYGVSP